jgi:hypothetical protein
VGASLVSSLVLILDLSRSTRFVVATLDDSGFVDDVPLRLPLMEFMSTQSDRLAHLVRRLNAILLYIAVQLRE